MNFAGSFELPFLKVLFTFFLKIWFLFMRQRWNSHFVFLFNLKWAVCSLYHHSKKPTGGCCNLHIRCLVALAFFLYFKGQKESRSIKAGTAVIFWHEALQTRGFLNLLRSTLLWLLNSWSFSYSGVMEVKWFLNLYSIRK